MRGPAALLAAAALAGHAGAADGGAASGGAEPPFPEIAVLEARLEAPTDRYGHDVLGGNEYARLVVVTDEAGTRREHVVELPADRVFEDVEARLFDPWGAGRAQAVAVVEASVAAGAMLAVYLPGADGALERIATPPIGRRNRWLAPAGIADFDGDGTADIAYVEMPHIGGTLRFVTLYPGAAGQGGLVETASAPGFSNHRIGEPFITSAVRDCGDGAPAVILPDFGWSGLMAVRLVDGTVAADRVPGEASLAAVRRRAACGTG